MNLKHLTDHVLLADLKKLAARERTITTEILHHLKEVERRKLFSDLGYSSMHTYVIKELNYSESSAVRRIQAARLLKDVPEIEKKINEGTLSLSNLSQASGFFKKEDIKDPKQKKEILRQLENKTQKECEKTLFELSPEQPLPKESVKVVSAEYHQIKIKVTDKTIKLMEDARALLGEFSFSDGFMKKLTEEALENIKRKKFKFTEKPRANTESKGRYVNNQTKRETSGNGVCENCGSLFMLNFEHSEPYALGGKSNAANIRLLCFNCNQRARIRAKL